MEAEIVTTVISLDPEQFRDIVRLWLALIAVIILNGVMS